MALQQPTRRDTEPPVATRRLHLREVETPPENQAYTGIGSELRKARLGTHRELDDVARQLRIQKEHLSALEDGRFDDLPGAAYAVGFLRTYAYHLGLDGEAAVAIFKEETERYPSRTKLVFPLPGPEGRLPGGWLIAASLMLAAVVYGGWYYISEQDRLAIEFVPAVPERLAGALLDGEAAATLEMSNSARARDPSDQAALARDDIAGPTAAALQRLGAAAQAEAVPERQPRETPQAPVAAPLDAPDLEGDGVAVELPATSREALTEAPESAAEERSDSASPIAEAGAAALDEAANEPVDEPVDIAMPTRVAALSDEPAAPPPVLESEGETAANAVSTAYVPQTYGAGNTDARVIIRARTDSWVQVRGPDGELLLTRVMRPGDRFLAPDRPNLTMITGNAGALDILVDGNLLAPIGPEGEVLRNVLLDVDRLLAGTAVTQ